MSNYLFQEYDLSVFQNNVTRLKVASNMADRIGIKDSDSRLNGL